MFTVASEADNRPVATTATFDSFAEAEAYMATVVRTNPALANAIHVIPRAEVNDG
jgi:hypothetical protein